MSIICSSKEKNQKSGNGERSCISISVSIQNVPPRLGSNGLITSLARLYRLYSIPSIVLYSFQQINIYIFTENVRRGTEDT
jgi:hypothetical protein